MNATLERLLILTTAAGFIIAAHFFPDQQVHLVGLSGVLIGYQIPFGTKSSPTPPT
jgi:hypothetical protein